MLEEVKFKLRLNNRQRKEGKIEGKGNPGRKISQTEAQRWEIVMCV